MTLWRIWRKAWTREAAEPGPGHHPVTPEPEVAPPPPPRPPPPTWRIVRHQHTGKFRVQKLTNYSWVVFQGSEPDYADYVPAYPGFDTQADAEAWIERELAGPKVVKEYP